MFIPSFTGLVLLKNHYHLIILIEFIEMQNTFASSLRVRPVDWRTLCGLDFSLGDAAIKVRYFVGLVAIVSLRNESVIVHPSMNENRFDHKFHRIALIASTRP